jgi:hypothetical protein
LSSNNEWELFGFDLRQLSKVFSRAWHDVFWAYQSPVRQTLDEPVHLSDWKKGEPLTAHDGASGPQALLLPDSHVLVRKIRLPRAALSSLSLIVSADVADTSPFLADDTVVGQRVDSVEGKTLVLTLVIASRSGVMSFLHGLNPNVSIDDYELWAESEGKQIVLEGFAEKRRNLSYKKRLMSLSGYMVAALLAMVLAMVLPWAYQNYRFNAVEGQLEKSRVDARAAMRLRNELVETNAQLHALQQYVDTSAQPLGPLTVLTTDIGSEAWLGAYDQTKDRIVIDGYAGNAAALIQQLTASNKFYGVKPLSAIRKVGPNQVERFRLELQLPDHKGEPR